MLKTREGGEQQILQVTLLGLPQGHTEGIKSLGTPLGQQVEELHILAETAHFGLRYKNKTPTHVSGYNSISPDELPENVITHLKNSFHKKTIQVKSFPLFPRYISFLLNAPG